MSDAETSKIDFSTLGIIPSWKDSVCGQCNFAKFLTEEMRIKAGGIGTPTMIDCWFNPPQIVPVHTKKGTMMLPPTMPRMPAIHPACGQFVYNAESQNIMDAQEKARSAIKELKPFSLIKP
jgi:hypothetical protein